MGLSATPATAGAIRVKASFPIIYLEKHQVINRLQCNKLVKENSVNNIQIKIHQFTTIKHLLIFIDSYVVRLGISIRLLPGKHSYKY